MALHVKVVKIYLKNLSLKYQILDQYADILNYTTPFTRYFYEVSSAIQDGIYIVNHLNFNPANMLTHSGFIFGNQVDEHSYSFIQNEKHTIDQSNLSANQTTNGCLIGIYFWMQNTLQHFERTYDRFQDELSNIGGISNIIMTLGYFINLLISRYISLLDTEELIISRDKMNYGEKTNLSRRPNFKRKVNEIENRPRREYRAEEKNLSSTNIGQFSLLSREKENLNNTNYIKNDEVEMNNCNNMSYNYKTNNNILKEKKQNENVEIKKNSVRKTSKNKNQKDGEESPIKRHNFNWFKYIWYLICCKSNDNMIKFWENIRNSLISEENIIQNYLDIYQILKINGLAKKDILNNLKEKK